MQDPWRLWQVGEEIEGRWKVSGVAPRGRWGHVYFVRDARWNVDLAVKTLRANEDARLHDATEESFRSETRHWLDLGAHPHIVTGFYTKRVEGRLRFFMEYVPSNQLEEEMDEEQTVERTLEVTLQLAAGMEHVHAKGVTHGDLHAGNCLVGRDGTIRITDFGLSKVLTEARQDGADPAPGDVFAFGHIVYRLLWKRAPWKASDMTAPPPLRSVRPETPAAVEELALRCVAPDPDRRPSFQAIREELRRAYHDLTGKEDPARPQAGLASTEASENNRAASYVEMGDLATARSILDTWLEKDQAALYPWVNRRCLELHEGAQPAGVAELFATRIAPRHRGAISVDSELLAFQARLDAHRLEHPTRVESVRFSADGRLLATGCGDGAVRVWRVETGELVRRITAVEDTGSEDAERLRLAVAFGPRAGWIVAAAQDGSLGRFRVDTGEKADHDDRYEIKAFEPRYPEKIRRLAGRRTILDVAVNDRGDVLLGCGKLERRLRLFERGVECGGWLRRADGDLWLDGHESPVRRVAFVANGAWIATADAARLCIRDAGTGEIRRRVEVKGLILAVSPDGELAASLERARLLEGLRLVLRSTKDGGEVGAFTGAWTTREHITHTAAFSRDGGVLAWGGVDGRIGIGDTRTREQRVIEAHKEPVDHVDVSPDGTLVASASLYGRVLVWRTFRAPPMPTLGPIVRRDLGAPDRIALDDERASVLAGLAAHDVSAVPRAEALIRKATDDNADRDLLGAIQREGALYGARGRLHGVTRLWAPPAVTRSVAFSPDGALVIVADSNDHLGVCEVLTGAVVHRIPLTGADEAVICLSGDGSRVAVSPPKESAVRVLDTKTGAPVFDLPRPSSAASALRFAPVGRPGAAEVLLVSDRDEGGGQVRRASDGRLLHRLAGLLPLGTSPDGRLLFARCAGEHTVRVLERSDGRPLGDSGDAPELVTAREIVHCGADDISADARFLFASIGERVHVWSTNDGEIVAAFPGHHVSGATDDGRVLLVGIVHEGATIVTRVLDRLHPDRSEAPVGIIPVAISRCGRFMFGFGSTGAGLWLLDWTWSFFEEVLPLAERALQGHAAELWIDGPSELDRMLDVWWSLARAAARPTLAPRQRDPLGAFRAELLARLARLARPDLRAGADVLVDPVYRIGLVDPALASDLERELARRPRPPGEGRRPT